MARKPKNSVYDRIEETKLEIAKTEQYLAQLKLQLEDLLHEKDDLEMRQSWVMIKESGMTFEEVQKLLMNNKPSNEK
jgi:hypothetical protein